MTSSTAHSTLDTAATTVAVPMDTGDDATPPPAHPPTALMTLAERAHQIMHPPPPPPSAAVLAYLETERALMHATAYRRCLTDVRKRLGAAIDEAADASTVAVGGIDSMFRGDDNGTFHREATDNVVAAPSTTTAASATTLAVPRASVMARVNSSRGRAFSAARRRRRSAIAARPTLLRRRLARAATLLQLDAATTDMVTGALSLITRRCIPTGPPRFTICRRHAATTLNAVERERAALRHASLADAARTLGVHEPATHAEHEVWRRFACDAPDCTTETDAVSELLYLRRVDAVARQRHTQTSARMKILKARLQVLAAGVVESLRTRTDQSVALENDGSVRLRAVHAVVTRDTFGDALCEHLLACGVADPRAVVLDVTGQVFM
jgi:hypothetical protein